MAEEKNTKRRLIAWLLLAAALVLAAVALGMARFGMGVWPYPVAAVAAVLLIVAVVFLRPNWAAIAATLASLAFLLRFAARGYAWWGYALLFVAALVVLHHFLPAVLWKIVVILTCIGLVYFCVVESFIIRNARTDADDGRDYLIVLGAAVYRDQPSLTLVRRMEGAMDYLGRHPDSIAIVSGGMGPGETVTEGQAMYDYMTAHGIDGARILVEDKATSTEASDFILSPSYWFSKDKILPS